MMTANLGPRSPTRILTWNVQAASPSRASRQAAWLATMEPADVLVLTDLGSPASRLVLDQALTDRGYTVHGTAESSQSAVAIAVRSETAEVIAGLYTGRLPHRVLSVRAVLPGCGTVGVVGVYVPSRGPQSRRNVDKRALQADLTQCLPELATAFGPDIPVVVGGDLNVIEPGHVPRHTMFGAWEYDFYRAFEEAGFVDLHRKLHPAGGHSWFGRANRGYRFDYLFATAASVPLTSDYNQQPRLAGLSDHAPQTVTVQLHPTP